MDDAESPRFRPVWRRSSYCGNSDALCLEVAHLPARVRVRDAACPGDAVVEFDPGAWAAFLHAVRGIGTVAWRRGPTRERQIGR